MPEPSPEEFVADARSASKTKRNGSSASIERQGEDTSGAPLAGRLASAWITAFLAISAAIVFGYHLVLAVGAADTETMESSMMWSVARQFTEGPEGLYGPYGAKNPLVLIHAPLYYRLAALSARPLPRRP